MKDEEASERPQRPRSRKKPEQKKHSLFRGCLVALLVIVAYTGALILAFALSGGHLLNFWGWLAAALLLIPISLAFIVIFIFRVRERVTQAPVSLDTPLDSMLTNRRRRRRRIARSQRAAAAQESEEQQTHE